MQIRIILALVFALMAGAWAVAQPVTSPPEGEPATPSEKIAGWQSRLDAVKKGIERIGKGPGDHSPLRAEASSIRQKAQELARSLEPEVSRLNGLVEKLGPAPKEGEAAEPETQAAERARLEKSLSEISGMQQTARVVAEEAGNLVSRIEALRRERFASAILERSASPLFPSLWAEVGKDLATALRSLDLLVNDWLARAAPYRALIALLFAAGVILVGLNILARSQVARGRLSPDRNPPFFVRAGATAVVSFWRFLPAAVTAVFVFVGLGHINLLPLAIEPLALSILSAFLIFRGVTAVARSLLAPGTPEWRLLPLPQDSVSRIYNLVFAMAGTWALDKIVHAFNSVVFAPLSLSVAQSFVFSLVFAVLFGLLLLTPWRVDEAHSARGGRNRSWPVWLKLPLWLVVIGTVVAGAIGYVALARFMTSQVVVTGSLLVAIVIGQLAVHAIVGELLSPKDQREGGDDISFFLGSEDGPRRRILALAIGLILSLLLLVVTLPFILLQWGVSTDQLRGWLEAAFFGFELGNFRISVAEVLIALAIFVGIIFLTRIFQRWLDTVVLSAPHFDQGLANSIRTGLGYTGVIVAAVLAISYTGLDFTNLAIVAGALSVGIGFGLQSIVNNFVSGLILLIERPIKVGDWIVVGGNEGYVRKISVRATEIETFDRSSVILPNAELLSAQMTNWTHRNSMGRVVVRVGVSYGADPDQVKEILLRIAHEHPQTLEWPKPSAYFEDFGDSALIFSLRAFIADVNYILVVKDELNTAILKAFREVGIEIPFPQHDIHLRDLDGVRSMLARVAAERARKQSIEPDGGEAAS